VSVYGTGGVNLSLEVFLGSLFTPTIRLSEDARYYQVLMGPALNLPLTYTLQRTIPSVRVDFTPSSPHRN
jgi:hypothetical protein